MTPAPPVPAPAPPPCLPENDAPSTSTPKPEPDQREDQDCSDSEDPVGGPSTTEGGPSSKAKKKRSKKAKKKKASADYFTPEESKTWEHKFSVILESTKSQLQDVSPEELRRVPDFFGGFAFTGELRPCYVTAQMPPPAEIPEPDHSRTGIPQAELDEDRGASIHVYSPEELVRVRKACRIGREVLDIAGQYLRAGVTGDEIDRIVYKACEERGAYPSPLNYFRFPKSVCVSPNEVICHGIPDCRPVEEGDIVNLDVSVYVDGMHADLNETFLIGKREPGEFSVRPENRVSVPEEARHLVKIAYEALRVACKMIKPGTFYRDVGNEVTKLAHAHQMGVVRGYSGHGTGRLFHTLPTIPHYANNKGFGIMRPGHVFTIEPMLNLGGINNWGDVCWPDNWTIVTKNGKASSQFEHTFLVTETGCEVLTARRGCSATEMPPWEEIEPHMWR